MKTSFLNDRSAVPWWAAFGAPLLGVPVLVGLLALGTATRADAGVAEGKEHAYAVDRTGAVGAGAVELPPVSFADEGDATC